MSGFISFRQADPNWGRDLLGDSKHTTMAEGGCAVTVVADAAVALGVEPDLTPGQLNNRARLLGGFVKDSGRMILERLASAAGLLHRERDRVREKDPSIEEDRAQLTNAIERSLKLQKDGGLYIEGGACVVNVDHTGDMNPDHFLLVVARAPGGGYLALDPAPGGGPIFIGPDLIGVSKWSTKTTKRYVITGAAPIGKGTHEELSAAAVARKRRSG